MSNEKPDIKAMSKCLDTAYRNYREAESHFHNALEREFPLGSAVTFRRGKHTRAATVIAWSADRLKVQGSSGKQYWVYWDRSFKRGTWKR